MMDDVCGDNRFELIAKYKAKLIEATNIETDKAEMDVIDNVLFRIWQMRWLDRLEQSEPLERRRGMNEEMKWIPVSERLPEHYHRVILTIRGTDMIKVEDGETLEEALKRNMKQYWVTDGYLADDGWNGGDGFPLIVKPIAWMEFPEPWKGEEDA